MRAVLSLVVAVLLVNAGWVLWWMWILNEERKQRERIRQLANGGGADLPPWLRLSERRKR